jgi:Yqey-like protein
MIGGHSFSWINDVAKPRPLNLPPARVNLIRDDPMIRDDIKAAQIAAMKAGDKETRNAVSLMQAAIKNRDIEARTGGAVTDDDALVVEVLQKMVKQRRDRSRCSKAAVVRNWPTPKRPRSP